MQRRGPVVGLLGELELLAFGKLTKRGLDTFPVNIFECGSCPGSCKEKIMQIGLCNESFAVSRSCGCCFNIVILLLGD
jgi:hypothetical protein